MLEDIPRFTSADFGELEDRNEGEFIAFVYDAQGEPAGTLIGNDGISMSKELKLNTHALNYRYVLVKVIENFKEQLIH